MILSQPSPEKYGINFPQIAMAYERLNSSLLNPLLLNSPGQLELVNKFVCDFRDNMNNWNRVFPTHGTILMQGSKHKVIKGMYGIGYDKDVPTSGVYLKHVDDKDNIIHPSLTTISVLAGKFGIPIDVNDVYSPGGDEVIASSILKTNVDGIYTEICYPFTKQLDDAGNSFCLIIDPWSMGLVK